MNGTRGFDQPSQRPERTPDEKVWPPAGARPEGIPQGVPAPPPPEAPRPPGAPAPIAPRPPAPGGFRAESGPRRVPPPGAGRPGGTPPGGTPGTPPGGGRAGFAAGPPSGGGRPPGLLGGRQGRHGRSGRGTALIALAAVIAGVLVTALVLHVTGGGGQPAPGPTAPAAGARQVVAPGVPASWPSWGFTHTQYTPDSGQGTGQALIDTAVQQVPQAQSIMGWGADNPEPSPGRFNFGSLDRRMQLITSMRGTPVITLCCAPDWMKGGAAGSTDWSKLEKAPDPAHFDDFATLAAEVAKRYPQVKYYVVWNEFKGFFSGDTLAYQQYTDFYNKVYSALKDVNPALKVGGPYVPMSSLAPGYAAPTAVSGSSWGSVEQHSLDAVTYWVNHKKGADFLVVDGAAMPDQPKGQTLDEFKELAKFADVTEWLRGQVRESLPVWWAEWYVEPGKDPGSSGWTDEHRGAVQAAAMMQFVKGGAATALYWSPQTSTTGDCPGCLWSGSASNGKGTPTLTMLQNFSRFFPPGTKLVNVISSNPAVYALAQPHEILVVNTSANPASSTVNGTATDLAGYEVRWIPV